MCKYLYLNFVNEIQKISRDTVTLLLPKLENVIIVVINDVGPRTCWCQHNSPLGSLFI